MAIYWCWKNVIHLVCNPLMKRGTEEKSCPGSQENWTLFGTARNWCEISLSPLYPSHSPPLEGRSTREC